MDMNGKQYTFRLPGAALFLSSAFSSPALVYLYQKRPLLRPFFDRLRPSGILVFIADTHISFRF